MRDRPLDPELYLAEAGWMRSMARQLLRDEHAADDVLQEVWLAARRAGPREGTSARAWIRSVARKLTLRRRRDDDARRGHEGSAAQRDDAPRPENAVERMELQRRLAEAVLALDEPYRTAVIERHLDGLSPGTIARRAGISREAARQRVARGIARLRARLDRDFDGGRSAWSLGLLSALRESGSGFGPFAPLVSTWSTLGGVAVASKTTVGLGLAAVAALALLVVVEGPGAGQPTKPVEAAVVRAEPGREQPAEPPRTGGRAAPPAELAERRAVAEAPAPSDALPTWRGVVVDSAGRPIEAATVVLVSGAGEALFPGLEPTVTDGTGAFALNAPGPAAEVVLLVEHERYVSREVPAEPAPADAHVTLLALPVLTGHLVPPAGDSLPERARVTAIVIAEGELDDERFAAEPDASGRYELTGLPPGRLIVVKVAARGYRESTLELDLTLLPEATEVLDLDLDPGAVVEGVVLDAVTEEPLVGAEVWADGWNFGSDELFPTAYTDGAGRFRLRGVADDVNANDSGFEYVILRVYARTERHASARASLHGRGYDQERRYEIELRLQPSDGRLTGRVSAPSGRAASGVNVRAVDSGANLFFAVTGSDGRFEFEDLRPGLVGVLAWKPLEDAEDSAVVGQDVPLAAGEHAELQLMLEPGRSGRIAGRVTDPGGQPAAGVRLEARLIFSGKSIAMNVDEVSAFTDAGGYYSFEGLPAGRYDVVPRPVNYYDDFCRRPHSERIDLEPKDDANEVHFVVGGCATWEGRVAAGELHPSSFRVHLVDPQNGYTLESTTPDSDGAFRLDELAGHYDLVVYQADEERSRTRVGPGGGTELVLPTGR
jgi:RNA polymerase sigma-70 factor (ECF subfamily)